MADEAKPGRLAATGQLLKQLLTQPQYSAKWQGHVQRDRGIPNQEAIAQVLALHLWNNGFNERDLALPTRLKKLVSKAFLGQSLSHQTLETFIQAFKMDEKDAQQLWAAFSGPCGEPTRVESFNPNTHESKLWTPQPRKLNDPQPNYNFVSRESEIHYYVNRDGLMYKSQRSRTLQAEADGFQFYYFNVAESRDSLTLKKIRLGVEPPAEISNVTQFSTNGYSWEIKLPNALEEGETYHLRFTKEIEATGTCDPWVIARTRNGQPPKMSVTFESDDYHPPYVWWFSGLISTASPGFFDEERRLTPNPSQNRNQTPNPDNQYTYAWDFTDTMGNGRVGIGWGW